MDALTKSIGSLLLDPKYSDLTIKCDGRTYYVHRAIVCSRSKVLAKQCDDASQAKANGVIEHTDFDVLTLERMLQFMYQGDYSVNVMDADQKNEERKVAAHEEGSASPKSLPPHLRNGKSPAKPASMEGAKSCKTPATNGLTAHVYVYAIADCYEVPELKSLALKRFEQTESAETTIDQFLDVAKAVYSNTDSTEDDLRKALLKVLIESHRSWMTDAHFIQDLGNEVELHQFTVAVMSSLANISTGEVSNNDLQAKAMVLLQSDLDQTSEELARANRRVREMESRLEKVTKDALQSQTKNGEAEKQLKKLEADVKLLKGKNDALVGESARANQNGKVATDNLAAFNAKNQQLLSETARADKATAIYKQIIFLINDTFECRHCGIGFDARLEKDDRTSAFPSGSMIRCRECRTRHYGTFVE